MCGEVDEGAIVVDCDSASVGRVPVELFPLCLSHGVEGEFALVSSFRAA